MSQPTKTQDKRGYAQPASSAGAVTVTDSSRIAFPEHAATDYGVSKTMWQTLVDATFPSAKTANGVLLALDYCKRRNLDPFKRPVHIVPMRVNVGGKWVDKETVWPGIGELRTTAFRTGNYAGCDPCNFGPTIDFTYTVYPQNRNDDDVPPEDRVQAAGKDVTIQIPEWAQMTVYRMVQGQRVAFPGPRVYWVETYATRGKSDIPNEMWMDRKSGQIEKCAEAAALRRAFPEELGGEYIVEEAWSNYKEPIKDVTPPTAQKTAPAEARPEPERDEPTGPTDAEIDAIKAEAETAARGGTEAFRAWWSAAARPARKVVTDSRSEYEAIAKAADRAAEEARAATKPAAKAEEKPAETVIEEQAQDAPPVGTRPWLERQIDDIEVIDDKEEFEAMVREVSGQLVAGSEMATTWMQATSLKRNRKFPAKR
jgi:phage recombination protein Bet